MGIVTMGRVVVVATHREPGRSSTRPTKASWTRNKFVGSIVPDALVDTGATMLSLPRRLVQQLGLRDASDAHGSNSDRRRLVRHLRCGPAHDPGRDCVVEVAEVADDCPGLIGQIPLESLDFVIDPVGQQLVGNPEHGGQHMMDLF